MKYELEVISKSVVRVMSGESLVVTFEGPPSLAAATAWISCREDAEAAEDEPAAAEVHLVRASGFPAACGDVTGDWTSSLAAGVTCRGCRQAGEFEERANAAAAVLSHFVPAFLTPDCDYVEALARQLVLDEDHAAAEVRSVTPQDFADGLAGYAARQRSAIPYGSAWLDKDSWR